MSTLEATATMLDDLNEEELLSVQWIITRIKNKQNKNQQMSKDEILNRLDESRKQADDGRSVDADVFIKELRGKYGL